MSERMRRSQSIRCSSLSRTLSLNLAPGGRMILKKPVPDLNGDGKFSDKITRENALQSLRKAQPATTK